MNSSQPFSHTGSSNGGAHGGQAQAGATVSLRKAPENIGQFKIRPLIGGPKLPLKFAFYKRTKVVLAVNIPFFTPPFSSQTSEQSAQYEVYLKELVFTKNIRISSRVCRRAEAT